MRERSAYLRIVIAALLLAALVPALVRSRSALPAQPKRLNPANWGSDHVGKPVPDFVTGDECLFCHREKIGTKWDTNRHNLTIRRIDEKAPALAALTQSSAKEFVGDVKYLMGHLHRQRFLKPAKAYGQLELLSVEWTPPRNKKPGALGALAHPHWDAKRFGDGCAGCHATAVDPKEKAFAALSLDCIVCHGNAPAGHTKKPELVFLAAKRKDSARVVTSICAQCHVRTGKSKSSGLPYPNNFVAGDNLFRDFQVDFSDQEMNKLSSADRHVLENVRDVVLFGRESVTCLTCHDVHGHSSKKHFTLAKGDNCLTCHNADGPMRERKPFSIHSKTCGY